MTVKEDEFGEVIAEARIVTKKTAQPAAAANLVEPEQPAPIEPKAEVVEAVIEPAAEISPEAEAPEEVGEPIGFPLEASGNPMGPAVLVEEPPPKPKPLVRFL